MGAGETAETDIEPARPWLDGEFSVCLCPLALNLVGGLLQQAQALGAVGNLSRQQRGTGQL